MSLNCIVSKTKHTEYRMKELFRDWAVLSVIIIIGASVVQTLNYFAANIGMNIYPVLTGIADWQGAMWEGVLAGVFASLCLLFMNTLAYNTDKLLECLINRKSEASQLTL